MAGNDMDGFVGGDARVDRVQEEDESPVVFSWQKGDAGAMFRLVRYFSISSAISLTAVTIILAIFYRQTAMNELVGMAESQNATLARSFANTIWPQFSRYLTSFEIEDAASFRSNVETRRIHEVLRSMTARLPVLKVKIYKLDGYTVFSSEIAQIGENKSDNPGFLMAARQGKVASKLAFSNTFSAFEGVVQKRDLVESYVPIHLADGSIAGVFELYSDVTPVTQRIGRTTATLIIGLTLIFGALYGLLFLIVRRADQTLKRQYLALQSSEEDIKVQNAALEFEVAERKQSEERSRKLSRAVEQSPATTIITDLAGNIEYVNPTFTRVTGYSTAEAMGKNSRFLNSGETSDEVYRDLWQTILSGKDWRGEFVNRKKNGDLYWAATSVSPITDQNGTVTHFLGISEDITAHKEAEELLRTAKQEAESANQAKSRFFAAASHDLRQPLHTISLYLPLLAKVVTAPDSREIVDAIQLSCTSMENLLNGLLDISKLEAGVVSPEIEPVSTRHLFQKLAIEFAVQAKENDADLRFVPVDLSVVTDPTLIERVLRNLLSNALRHTPQGRVLFGARRRGSRLRFEIWDTGVGIAEEDLPRIFQEFYQIGNIERDSNRGLGLGLAIVDRVTKLLGHRVDVRSVPGKGSMFAVEVPIDASACPMSGPSPSADGGEGEGEGEGEDLTGLLVLLVEDNVEVLKGTRRSLEDWGCRVIEAQSIEQAAARISQSDRPPDFILADFRLRNNETGAAAIERVCRLMGRPVPAAIITGDTDPRRLQEATESGFVLLHKPVRPGQLRTLLASECRAVLRAATSPG